MGNGPSVEVTFHRLRAQSPRRHGTDPGPAPSRGRSTDGTHMHHRSLALFLSASALALSTPALGQQAVDLDEVVFFYALTPTDTASTGANVTVITEDDLRAAGDQALTTFLGRLPGVGVVQSGPIGAVADIRIRGAHQRYTSIYVDGVRIDDPSNVNGVPNPGTLTTGDIGRIEVLRGSQSARFGAGAVGGVINITSRQATEEGFSGRSFVELGSYRTFNSALGFSNVTEAGALHFNLTRLQTRGFSAFDENEGATDPDGFRATRLSVSGRHALTDTFTIGGSAFAQRSRREYDDFEFDPELGLLEPVDADNVGWRREVGLRAFGEYELGAHRHVMDVTFFNTDRTTDDDQGVIDWQGRRIGASYVGSSPLGDMVTLNYGLDYERESGRQQDADEDEPTFNVTESRWGAYAEALYAPSDALDLSAIVRHDRHSNFGGRTTGRVAAAWRLTPELTLRGVASTGYNTPDMPQRFGAFNNPDLQPETSRSAEIGADYAFANGARLSGTVFYLTARDEIAFAFDEESETFGSLNIEATRRSGLELELSAPLGDGVELGASYTYTNAVITAGPNEAQRIGRVPRHDVGLSVDARFADRWRAHGNLQFQSDRLNQNGAAPMPSFAVVNASVSYEIDAMTDMTLRVDNVFDRQYQLVDTYGTSDRAVYLGLARRF